jgi:predicted  nucleic acid-binding Zn-ribbon protein
MKHTEMTLPEFLAWKSGDFEEYKSLISRTHWLESHIRGAGNRLLDAEDSMSVFRDDEHEDEQYLKYKADYDKAQAQIEKWSNELEEVEKKLTPFMRRADDGGHDRRTFR